MSRAIQFRRGTTAEHESFTGAIGEITVDTDLQTIRVHDGQTPGGSVIGWHACIMPDYSATATELSTAANTWIQIPQTGYLKIMLHSTAGSSQHTTNLGSAAKYEAFPIQVNTSNRDFYQMFPVSAGDYYQLIPQGVTISSVSLIPVKGVKL